MGGEDEYFISDIYTPETSGDHAVSCTSSIKINIENYNITKSVAKACPTPAVL
jgi:hypothetical protein